MANKTISQNSLNNDWNTMADIPLGVTPIVPSYSLLRDEIVKMAGIPFKRLLVYRLTLPLPLPNSGVALFAIREHFVIGSITTSATDPFTSDANYAMTDVADGSLIGVVQVRAGRDGTFPVAVPDLPANLAGPARVTIRPLSGIQDVDGSVVIQISVSGPPLDGAALALFDLNGDGIPDDLNRGGIPDDLEGDVVPIPPVAPEETADDFFAGYDLGVRGETVQ